MFPINPVPYIIPYIIIIFLLPWSIFAIKLIIVIFKIYGNSEEKRIFGIKKAIIIKKSQPEIIKKHNNLKKWIFITITCWIVGFFSLVLILSIMEYNNLLINHSKGLYGPNVQHKIIDK